MFVQVMQYGEGGMIWITAYREDNTITRTVV